MYIYIDESGVINPNKESPFIITFLLIKNNNHKKIINAFKNKENKIRKNYFIEKNEEMKGIFYFKKNLLKEINPFIEKIIRNNKIVCVCLENKDINSKWLEDKVLTYNFMIKLGLERIYDSYLIPKNEIVKIYCDNRKIKVSKYDDIKTYINREFNILKETKIKTFKFCDSKHKPGIRLVDLVSFTIHGNLRKLNNFNLKDDVIFRKVY